MFKNYICCLKIQPGNEACQLGACFTTRRSLKLPQPFLIYSRHYPSHSDCIQFSYFCIYATVEQSQEMQHCYFPHFFENLGFINWTKVLNSCFVVNRCFLFRCVIKSLNVIFEKLYFVQIQRLLKKTDKLVFIRNVSLGFKTICLSLKIREFLFD